MTLAAHSSDTPKIANLSAISFNTALPQSHNDQNITQFNFKLTLTKQYKQLLQYLHQKINHYSQNSNRVESISINTHPIILFN